MRLAAHILVIALVIAAMAAPALPQLNLVEAIGIAAFVGLLLVWVFWGGRRR